MNSMKKALLSITLLTTLQAVAHDSGWGGFGAGLFTGAAITGIGAAASRSGDPKPDAYYESQDREKKRRRIEKDIKGKEDEKRDHQRALDKLDKNKKLTADERTDRRKDHTSAITDIEEEISDLKKDLRRI